MMKLITSLIMNEEIVLTDYIHSEDIDCVNICGKSKNGDVTFLNGLICTNDLDLAYKLKHTYGLFQVDKIDAQLSGAKPGDIMFHAEDFKKDSTDSIDKIFTFKYIMRTGSIWGQHNV